MLAFATIINLICCPELVNVNLQELVKDDNKCSACPTIDLTSLSKHSAYKYNRASYFMECRLVALQWDRSSNLIRQVPQVQFPLFDKP